MRTLTLYGRPERPLFCEDVTREVARVKGVREVRSRLAVQPPAAA